MVLLVEGHESLMHLGRTVISNDGNSLGILNCVLAVRIGHIKVFNSIPVLLWLPPGLCIARSFCALAKVKQCKRSRSEGTEREKDALFFFSKRAPRFLGPRLRFSLAFAFFTHLRTCTRLRSHRSPLQPSASSNMTTTYTPNVLILKAEVSAWASNGESLHAAVATGLFEAARHGHDIAPETQSSSLPPASSLHNPSHFSHFAHFSD